MDSEPDLEWVSTSTFTGQKDPYPDHSNASEFENFS